MRLDLAHLGENVNAFLTERHLATLTTLRRDGSPHVVPVGFTFDPATRLAWVITSGDSVKARNAARPDAVAALCQVDGASWVTLSGPVSVDSRPEVVTEAEQRYARRYRQPRVNPRRVALLISVTSALGAVRRQPW